ncbi:MAG: glycosyltransferase family 2 protein [Candidatus Omnitrophica bacterium]|nr:glycosyltransferase family 2 protein [Candidatus Omnitrophota bacterium]
MFVVYSKPAAISQFPSVAIVIAAHNEEEVITEKIENSLLLDYPREQLNIWVASDGSNDGTNRIVSRLASDIDCLHFLECARQGKAQTINSVMEKIDAEIVIFSDANTEYDKRSVKELIKHFNDETVGCVCGRLIYRNPNEVISGKGENFYWRYETQLKMLESRLGYVAGANGAIYAIRRNLFKSLPCGTINDDFMTSMGIVKRGFKCLYEEKAVAYEYVAPTTQGEFKRHVRDGAGHYIAIRYLLELLSPLLGIRAFIYWSHRVLRWLAPFILALLLVINVFLLGQNFYRYILFLQIIFYATAICGLCLTKYKKVPFLVYIPFYFCNLNLALLFGFFEVILGKQKGIWERTERRFKKKGSSLYS